MAYMKRMSEANIPTNLMQPQELLSALTTGVMERIIYIILLRPTSDADCGFPPYHTRPPDVDAFVHPP
jgi:hypothetical protein